MSAPVVAVAVLVAPGVDPAPALRCLGATGVVDAVPVVLPAPGAWAAARNAAVAGADGADVLACVDADVLVGPAWLAAVGAAYAADDGLAVAGGPIRARSAPPWLVGAHDEVLGLVAPAAGAPVLDGGNVAFRLDALRGVGGFFPARGHRDARDTFTEDRRAQHELRAVGWTAAWVEAMAAERDLAGLTPAALLRRRARTGARRQALAAGAGPRSAARLLVGGAGAAAVRAARGDRAGALDRAAWAADGLGGLAGGLLAHAGLQPDRTRTPLRVAVPAPAPHPVRRALRRVRRPGRGPVHGAVLLYHRVVAAPAGTDPLALAVQPEHFAAQLAVLRERYAPAGLADVVAGRAAGPRAVAVTFDDGYHDTLAVALPALEAAGVPATLFASTGHIATGAGFWWDEVAGLLHGAPPAAAGVLALDVPGGRRAWRPRDAAQAAAVRAHVHAALQTRDRATIDAALGALRGWAGRPTEPAPPPARDRPLTVEELRTLAAAGPVAIGAHGRTHVSLAHAAPELRERELRGSGDDLATWLGARPVACSYPFGIPGTDVDAATRDAARTAGYALGTVNAPGLVRAGTDPLAVPRLAVPDVDGAAFAAWLDAAFDIL